MTKNINAGVIGADISAEVLNGLSKNRFENISWRKVYASGTVTMDEGHPGTEIVHRAEEIINDNDIDLVFVSDMHLEFVKPVIESGKSVRVL